MWQFTSVMLKICLSVFVTLAKSVAVDSVRLVRLCGLLTFLGLSHLRWHSYKIIRTLLTHLICHEESLQNIIYGTGILHFDHQCM